MKLEKGDTFTVDRFNNGNIMKYTVQRICRKHINAKYENGVWAMPYSRVKDIIEINEHPIISL